MRTIRFAIQLMVPKVEDGNNLGVEMQETTIHALSRAENQALARLNQFYRYFTGRGNIVSLIAKYLIVSLIVTIIVKLSKSKTKTSVLYCI